MKKSILRLLAFSALLTSPLCALAQVSISAENPPEEGWSSEGVLWSVVDDGEGGKAIEFRNENDGDFIGLQTLLEKDFADTLADSGFVFRFKVKILPVSSNGGFSFSLNSPRLSGIQISFFRTANSPDGAVKIGSYDTVQEKHLGMNVNDALDRYMDVEAKVVPDSNGAKCTVSVDGSEMYSFQVPATESQRRDFNIISGNKDNTEPKAIFLIKNLEITSL